MRTLTLTESQFELAQELFQQALLKESEQSWRTAQAVELEELLKAFEAGQES